MIKKTFIFTSFNEDKEIDKFLESIFSQSILPDEVVIVDGGSSDETVARIKNYEASFKRKGVKYKLIIKKGNIAKGRNEAIKNAKNEIILVSDAGCVLDKNWAKNISEPFRDKNIDVVAGYYKPIGNSIFQKCLATYTSVMPDKIDAENFLPSSRSVAFRKSAWKSVGGYPEWLDTCEDLFFARELKRKGFKFKFAKNATVLWPQRKNLKEAYLQFYNYAKGDGMARYIRPNTPLLFARYSIGIALVILALETRSVDLVTIIILLLVGYILWSIAKNYKYVGDPKALFYLPLLQFTSDIAVILGMSIGLIKGLSVKRPQV